MDRASCLIAAVINLFNEGVFMKSDFVMCSGCKTGKPRDEIAGTYPIGITLCITCMNKRVNPCPNNRMITEKQILQR